MADAPVLTEIDYLPRYWAEPFHDSPHRWAALVLHRRAGKTTALLNHHIRAATDDDWEAARLRRLLPDISVAHLDELLRVRLYGHVLPLLSQAKLSSWDMLKYYAGFVPGAKMHESELRVDFPAPEGHIRRVRLFGADNMDAVRGAAFAGLSLDEYGQHPPTGFGEVLSKALADHLGYCIWAGTIKGKNQLYRTWDAGKADPEWYTCWQDVDASLATEDDAATVALVRAMEDDRKLVARGIMTQEEYDQEWYLRTEAAIRGAIYRKEIAAARAATRITSVPHDPAMKVDTTWDLGVGDATAIWFSQSLRSGEVRLVDYYEASGEGLPHYVGVLQRLAGERGYVYGQHWAPPDIQVRELGSGKSRLEVAAGLGLKYAVVPDIGLEDGINALRLLWPRLWIDATRCASGLEALTHYRRKYNDRLQEFSPTPEHDWSSHGCLVAGTMIATNLGNVPIEQIKVGDLVATPRGYRRVEWSGCVSQAAEVLEAEFANGTVLSMTPEHYVFTESGLERADALSYNSVAISIRSRTWMRLRGSWSSTAGNIGYRAVITARKTGGRARPTFIARCGSIITDLFRRGLTSIIGVVTHWTTPSTTWNVCLADSILATTHVLELGVEARRTAHSWQRVEIRLLHGIGLPKGARGTVNTLARWWTIYAPWTASANTAGGPIGCFRWGCRSSAQTTVRHAHGSRAGWITRLARVTSAARRLWRTVTSRSAPALSVVRIRRVAEPRAVFDLTVAVDHCYYANGVLVSNSDAARYLAVWHKPPQDKRPVARQPFQGSGQGPGWLA